MLKIATFPKITSSDHLTEYAQSSGPMKFRNTLYILGLRGSITGWYTTTVVTGERGRIQQKNRTGRGTGSSRGQRSVGRRRAATDRTEDRDGVGHGDHGDHGDGADDRNVGRVGERRTGRRQRVGGIRRQRRRAGREYDAAGHAGVLFVGRLGPPLDRLPRSGHVHNPGYRVPGCVLRRRHRNHLVFSSLANFREFSSNPIVRARPNVNHVTKTFEIGCSIVSPTTTDATRTPETKF